MLIDGDTCVSSQVENVAVFMFRAECCVCGGCCVQGISDGSVSLALILEAPQRAILRVG